MWRIMLERSVLFCWRSIVEKNMPRNDCRPIHWKKQDLFDAACKSVLEVNTLHFTDSGFGCQLSFNQAIYLFGILGVFNTITFRHVCQPHFWYSIEKYTAGGGSWHRQDTRTLGATIQCLVGQRQSLLDENFNLNAVPGGNCSSYLHGQFVRETLSWPK